MAEQVSDAILLERFVRQREDAAFTALIQRHRLRLQGTCRRVLRSDHDIEDVLQATYLVLARKAARIPWHESVGSWLCAVAHRLAMSARADATRLGRREISFAQLGMGGASCHGEEIAVPLPERYHPLDHTAVEVECRDLRQVVDNELLQLPEKYRAPVVLCDLEGRTHQEAAEVLGWPSGSISRRLERARALLRRRLVDRGVTLTIGVAGITLAALVANLTMHRHDRQNTSIRQVMAQLKPFSEGTERRIRIADTICRDQSALDLAELYAIAGRADQVASEIARHDPGRMRDLWLASATEMHNSAALLTKAAQENDRAALVSAALRLDATCVKCHDVFLE
jgi:RNA polymerase sigma factor (sigma-70 family)